MLHRRETTGWLTVAILLTGSLTLSGATPELQGPQAIAQREIGPTRVDWLPKAGDYERLTLTVAGPGDFYAQRDFAPGEAPSFSSLDAQGGRLPDGVYAYELRAVPRPDLKLIARPWVQSGHLWLHEGSFVDNLPAQLDPPRQGESAPKTPRPNVTPKDIVQNDDLIVVGQACVGADCVNGDADEAGVILKLRESFGGQIKFQALNCCVPYARVWALQANDPASTSGDFLIRDLTAGTVPFRIGSGVPDNAFTILFNGNIGLGTLTPAVRLDVKASAAGQSAARLQSSSATGFSGIEYLDNAGNVDLYFGIDNAASTTRLNSVNNNPILLMTNSAERMRITSGGNVGVGTSTPDARLDVEAADSVEIRMSLTGSNVWQLINNYPGFGIQLAGTGFRAVNVDGGGNMQLYGTLTQGSSRDLKTDFVSLDPQDVLAKVKNLPVSTWRYKLDGPEVRHVGPTAEDFHKAFGLGGDDKRIAPSDQAGVALVAVQGLTQEVETLRRKNADLEERLAALETLLTALKPQE